MYVISRFNQDINWLKEYTEDWVMYDRSDIPIIDPRVVVVPNSGSDIYDKLRWIIDNYDNLPDIVFLIKANLFKYISKEEFDLVKDNKIFTPIVTKNHKVDGKINFYKDGMYCEVNNAWYLNHFPLKSKEKGDELGKIVEFKDKPYLSFAPGANYILPKANILQHPKEFYVKLISYLGWAGVTTLYEGESQIIERAFYYIFK